MQNLFLLTLEKIRVTTWTSNWSVTEPHEKDHQYMFLDSEVKTTWQNPTQTWLEHKISTQKGPS